MLIINIQNKRKKNNKKFKNKNNKKLKMKYKIKDQEIYLDQALKDNRKKKNHQIFQIDFQLQGQEPSNQ